jgi:hypothetical protein
VITVFRSVTGAAYAKPELFEGILQKVVFPKNMQCLFQYQTFHTQKTLSKLFIVKASLDEVFEHKTKEN